uniref:Uncharacterized protein n=1 Tax=Anguilla anguilla TaxID=7936 RepID=A0A0E9SRK7_ANGAN
MVPRAHTLRLFTNQSSANLTPMFFAVCNITVPESLRQFILGVACWLFNRHWWDSSHNRR